MAGHSKWANIKRRKAAVDAKRGKIFTRHAREIITAAREGGGDVTSNARLRGAIAAAKADNMPNANIDKAIKRGTGEIEGASFEAATYEGYGPGGVAIFIDAVTDNKNRTVGEIRHLLTKNGGSMADAGSVAWMFDQKGNVELDPKGRGEEEIMELVVEAGAEDFSIDDGTVTVTTAAQQLFEVREALEGKGEEIRSAELVRVPQNTVKLEGKEAEQMLRLMEALEDHDDVQRVSANFDVPDEILQAHGG